MSSLSLGQETSMPDHRGIRILEEVIGQRNPGGERPLPIKRYSCTVRGLQIRGTLNEVKQRIDQALSAARESKR